MNNENPTDEQIADYVLREVWRSEVNMEDLAEINQQQVKDIIKAVRHFITEPYYVPGTHCELAAAPQPPTEAEQAKSVFEMYREPLVPWPNPQPQKSEAEAIAEALAEMVFRKFLTIKDMLEAFTMLARRALAWKEKNTQTPKANENE